MAYWISSEKAQIPKNIHGFSYKCVPKFQLFFKKVATKQVHQLDVPSKEKQTLKNIWDYCGNVQRNVTVTLQII